jgi:hypothetical protein
MHALALAPTLAQASGSPVYWAADAIDAMDAMDTARGEHPKHREHAKGLWYIDALMEQLWELLHG